MKKYILVFTIIALTACGDDSVKPNEAAKVAKSSYAVMLESPSYTQDDLDYLNNIKSGNARRVKSMLDNGDVNVYSTDDNDTSGLTLAAQLKNSEITEAILAKTDTGDAKVLDRGDNAGKTPMIYAAEAGGAADIITMLRKKGANPNIFDPAQNFALLIAAKKGDVESVRAIIRDYGDENPANPDLRDANGETAAIAAAKIKNNDIVKLLKDYGADFNIANNEEITPLIAAINSKDQQFLDYIVSLGVDINALNPTTQRTPLLYVLANKNYAAAKYLLDKGADPNLHANGLSSPLQAAVSVENADVGIVGYLLQKGAKLNDPTIPLGNVLGRGIHKGNAPAIAKLIASGAKVSDLETASSNGIIQALNEDDADIAILMIDNGAEVSKMDEDGFSPLALAAKKKLPKVFEALIKKGADVNQTSRNKSAIPIEIVMTDDDAEMLDIMFNNGLKASADAVLLRAVSAKTNNIIPVAIKHGARPNIMNSTGQPILWLAIAKDDDVAAKALIDAGALLDVQDNGKGISPLSLAIARVNTNMTNYLIDKNANPDLVDNNGFSSLAYAAVSGQTEVVKNLIAHHAEVNAVDKSGNSILSLVDLGKIPKEKKDEVKKILREAGAK